MAWKTRERGCALCFEEGTDDRDAEMWEYCTKLKKNAGGCECISCDCFFWIVCVCICLFASLGKVLSAIPLFKQAS